MGKTVFTNGCFDILHPGHIRLLMQCRDLAGFDGSVVVAIDSDGKVAKDKGPTRPIFSEQKRQTALLDLTYPRLGEKPGVWDLIDQVRIFETNEELHEIIKELKPDVIVKGSDWAGNVVGSDVASVYLVPVDKDYSTSETVKTVSTRVLSHIFAQDTAVYLKPFQMNVPEFQCTCSGKFEDGQWWHTTEACFGQKRIPPKTDLAQFEFTFVKK